LRHPLDLVFSSVLTKVSRRAAETARREVNKRLAGGYTIRLFEERTWELVERFAESAELFGSSVPDVQVHEGDARELKAIKDRSVDLVVSSPPYPGVFDHLDHHELRLRWLGMPTQRFAQNEIGARRQMGALGAAALARWEADLSFVLRAIARVLKPQARACLVIADSVVGRRPVYADQLLQRLAGPAGLEIVAVASQTRPYFHRPTAEAFNERNRREHVVVLRPAGSKRREVGDAERGVIDRRDETAAPKRPYVAEPKRVERPAPKNRESAAPRRRDVKRPKRH
jgi:hypothetical protein